MATREVPIAEVSGMPVARINTGTIRKPPPMPKKPEKTDREADTKQKREKFLGGFCRQPDIGVFARLSFSQHHCADDDHHGTEKH